MNRARTDGHHYNYQTRVDIYTPLSIILARFLLHYAQTACIFEPASRALSSFTTVYREMRAKLLPPILVYLRTAYDYIGCRRRKPGKR